MSSPAMARTHPRDASPDAETDDTVKLIKRLKTSLDTPSDPTDPAPHFASGLFDHNNIARLYSAYNTADPFKHALVEKLFQDDLLVKVKEECISQLSFSEKETDIYKVGCLALPLPLAVPPSLTFFFARRSTKRAISPHSITSLQTRSPSCLISSPFVMHSTPQNFVTSSVRLPVAVPFPVSNRTCLLTHTQRVATSSITTMSSAPDGCPTSFTCPFPTIKCGRGIGEALWNSILYSRTEMASLSQGPSPPKLSPQVGINLSFLKSNQEKASTPSKKSS